MTRLRSAPGPTLPLAAVLSAVAIFMACAGRGPATPSLMTLPQGQECQWSTRPAALPAADALVDSLAVMDVVGRTMGDGGGYVVTSVSFDSTGAAHTPRLVETALSEEAAARFLDGLEPLIRPQTGSLRVLLRAEPSRLQVGRSLVCRPQLNNLRQVQAAMSEAMTRHVGLATGNIRPSRPALLWLFVDTTGLVTRSRLEEQSGVAAWDQIALQATELMRFHPARNNVLVPVWVAIRLSVDEAEAHQPPRPSGPPARRGLPPRE